MNDILLKKARKKFLASMLARELCTITDSPLNKAYRLSTACCNNMYVDSRQELSSSYYCRRRWCQTCASISMSIQIDNYYQPLSQLNDLYFVTLTRRSVQKVDLIETIETMQKKWRQITDLARKSRTGFDGVRKLELKVGAGGYGYHPHYHIIIQGKDNAEWLVAQWLKRSKESVIKAQDITQVNNLDNALVELMKYATKLTCADSSNNEVLCSPVQMDTIFTALHRRRLFQPFGTVRVNLNEDAFEPTKEQVMRAQGLYNWIGHDWFHELYGHPLSGFIPEGSEVQIYTKYKH